MRQAFGSGRTALSRRPAGRPSAWREAGPERTRVDRFAPGRRAPSAATAKLARLEAALIVADKPLSSRRLAEAASLIDAKEATALLEELNARYDAAGTAFRAERVARGWRLLTRRHLAPWLDRLHARPTVHSLSAPLLETLTVVAYRQPCTRADVDAVRGVQSADLLKQLLIDKKLIRTAGEEQTLGRPFLYETTPKFLETFGLKSLGELPEVDGLERPGGS